MTADDFRRIALAMDGAEERAHMRHPDFRANGKIFATLRTDDEYGVLKLTPDEQRELMRESPVAFTPASGSWGRQGWTMVCLSKAEPAIVRGAMVLAWQHIASAAPRPRARKSPRR